MDRTGPDQGQPVEDSLTAPAAYVDYSGPGGDHDLRSDRDFESQHPETKDFADLTEADWQYLAREYPDEYGDDADGM